MSFDIGDSTPTWIMLLFPNKADLVLNDDSPSYLLPMDDHRAQDLLRTGRWVEVPENLNEFCELDGFLCDEERWDLEDHVNVVLRRLLSENVPHGQSLVRDAFRHSEDNSSQDRSAIRDEFFVLLMQELMNGQVANEHYAACIDMWIRERKRLPSISSIHRDFKYSLQRINKIIKTITQSRE